MTNGWLARLHFPPDAAPHEPRLWLVSVLIPLLGGLLTFAAIAPGTRPWRESLVRSRLTPPHPLVAVLWVVAYTAMGHAAYRTYTSAPPPQRSVVSAPCVAYMAHVLLNHFYIIVLFGLRRVDLAFCMIFVLWGSGFLTAFLFYEVDAMAGALFGAVMVWVGFNVYLNFVLVKCNCWQPRLVAESRGKLKGKAE